jgi:chromosome segregation ATPase
MMTQMMESAGSDSIDDVTARILSESPTDRSFLCADASVILKCQSLIDELQEELDSQRERYQKLETELAKTKSELKRMHDEDYVGRIRDLEKVNAELEKRLLTAERATEAKDIELENMTKHFEKRMDEMKRQLKHQSMSVTASTPPIPSPTVRVSEHGIKELRDELEKVSLQLVEKDGELKEVVESYERQVSMLRQQLVTSQSFFKNYYSTKCDVRTNPFRDY